MRGVDGKNRCRFSFMTAIFVFHGGTTHRQREVKNARFHAHRTPFLFIRLRMCSVIFPRIIRGKVPALLARKSRGPLKVAQCRLDGLLDRRGIANEIGQGEA